MKSALLAKNAGRARSRRAELKSLPAPIGGWSLAENLSRTSPATAQVMDNWRPTTTGVALRAGSKTHATVSLIGDPVVSMFDFNGLNAGRLFAATDGEIYDVTTVASDVVPPAPAVSGRSSGYYSTVNFTTSGGPYLTAVNGTDPLLLYSPTDGFKPITAVSTPAITGVETSKLSFVWVYRARQFFIEADSFRAHFLPVSSVAGALGTVDLSGVFRRGGKLLFGGTWSMDAGDGLDDKCVFVTTEGEVAIFEGSNPASANRADWDIVGRYDISRPLGPLATMRAGGDLLIATQDGLVPISDAVSKDVAALAIGAVSQPIYPAWRRAAADRSAYPWEIIKFPEMGYAYVSLPAASEAQDNILFVVNTSTGKWCRYTNWDARCLATHAGRLYFGTSDGRVKLAETGGSDDGAGIYHTLVSNPEHLGARGRLKTILQARATYSGARPFMDKVSASMNYVVQLPSPPASVPDVQSDEWDAGEWDDAVWDAPTVAPVIRANWVSIGMSGHVMQYQIQVTSGLATPSDVELISVDVSFDPGEAVV